MKWIEEIKERLSLATLGPWQQSTDGHVVETVENRTGICSLSGLEKYSSAQAEASFTGWTEKNYLECIDDGIFISHSRTDVEKLIKALELSMEALKAYENFEIGFKAVGGTIDHVLGLPKLKPLYDFKCNPAKEALDKIKSGDL